MYLKQTDVYFGIFMVSIFIDLTLTVDVWNMQDHCGKVILSYGGELHFDANLYPYPACRVVIAGNGTDNSMLSFYFQSFNVSTGCMANLTLQEESYLLSENTGLSQSYCEEDPYLNANMMFTTLGKQLSLTYTKKVTNMPITMKFILKFTTFISRVAGCTEKEVQFDNMYSCHTGRCVYKDLVCQDLNPCGDDSDCSNVTRSDWPTRAPGGGFQYIKFVVITVFIIFAVFAIIQLSLVIRNEHTLCHWKDPKVRIEAELMSVPNGDVYKDERSERESLFDHNNA